MGDIAFDESSLPLWLIVRVRKRGSAEMPFPVFLCACLDRNVSMVTSVWERYFPSGLLRFGLRGFFLEKLGPVWRLYAAKPNNYF